MALSTAYWSSQTLLTANRIGLFALLAQGPLSAAVIADRLGTAPRYTELFLRACVGLGLLDLDDTGFRNALRSETFLVPGKPTYLGDALGYSDDLYSVWGQLEVTLRTGTPALAPESYLGQDRDQTRHFVRGMHNRALAIGRELLSLVDLTGCARLLDIGGGPGTYSALFAQRYPGLKATVLDLPDVVAIASEILVELGMAGSVDVLPGDYHETPFPEGQDVVLISGVFHRETPTMCRSLIARAEASLASGGHLLVSDVFTDAGGVLPPFATLFGINMMLTAADGGVHCAAEVADWMNHAGLIDVIIKSFPDPMPHRLVTGRKP
jgi:SAM-dependent methyltransferase